jgi:hypothetical protein
MLSVSRRGFRLAMNSSLPKEEHKTYPIAEVSTSRLAILDLYLLPIFQRFDDKTFENIPILDCSVSIDNSRHAIVKFIETVDANDMRLSS